METRLLIVQSIITALLDQLLRFLVQINNSHLLEVQLAQTVLQEVFVMFSKSILTQLLVPMLHFTSLQLTKQVSVFQLQQAITKLQIQLSLLVMMGFGELKVKQIVPYLVPKDSVVQQEQSHNVQQVNIVEEELGPVQLLLIVQLDSIVLQEQSMKSLVQVVLFH